MVPCLQTLDTGRALLYSFKSMQLPPTMKFLEFFKTYGLTRKDALFFVETLTVFHQELGKTQCWCLKTNNTRRLKGFTTSHGGKPLYKGKDARLLLLALVDMYQENPDALVVRKHCCNSVYCLNPGHYFFGTKKDVCLERGKRRGSAVTEELITKLRGCHKEGRTFAYLAKQNGLPYHVVRRICIHEVYD